jgi:thermitase
MSKRFRAVAFGLVLALAAVATGWQTPGSAAVKTFKVNDPLFGRQWGLRRVGAPAAWQTTQGAGMTIAIVDTGVDRRHEDLAANFLIKKQYDAINNDFDAADLHGHGTSVAGVAAAVGNNRKGVTGVAPKAKIMPVRAFGALEGAAPEDVSDAVRWAADNGANVINLSLGAALPIDPFLTDLQEVSLIYAAIQGSLVVAAAGNSTSPFCSTPAFNPAVLCVGASDEYDRLADFSSYGLRLDVVAPGTSILSTDRFGFYTASQGTSVAAPIVSGVGALLMSMGASNVLAAQIIRSTAKDLGVPGYDVTYGFGRLDAKAAVEMCKQIC